MNKIKIQDLQVGKFYRAFYKGVEQNGVFKVGNSGRLFTCTGLEWENSLFYYNEMFDTTFEEIEREIDWTKVPRGTKVQVRDEEEEEWLNRYFLKIVKEEYEEDYFEVASYEDNNFTGYKMEYYCSYWKYCRVHESVLIPDEWYKEVK